MNRAAASGTMVLLVLFALLAPTAARAQDALPAPAASTVDASKLGVDLGRIKRELDQAAAEDAAQVVDGQPLRLKFSVAVIGIAPRIDFLQGYSLSGGVPYGPPTHREVLDVLTPQEFRTPVFSISSLAAVAAQKLWTYNKKRQCQAEIEEYRRAVMAGVAMTAPRCSQ